MSYAAWPSPDSPRGPLPRIEDMPIVEQGYDQEAVREAFDSFYRHAAQLDASLKTLEGVEAFRRDAMELRSDLRSLRSLGFGDRSSWTPSYAYERARPELPPAVLRLAAEAALVIAVAVVAGVAHFKTWLIVALMAAAWAIVAASEWLAARARVRIPVPLYDVAAERELESPPSVEKLAPVASVGWSGRQEQAEEPGLLTMVEEQPPEAAEEDAVAEQEARTPEEQAEPEHAPAAQDEVPERQEAQEPEPEPEQPPEPAHEHELEPTPAEAAEVSAVDDLPVGDPGADPWEQGFDSGSPQEEPEPELVQRLGRIRRRRR